MANNINQYLTFWLEDNECAISIENVQEVLEYRPVTPIPHTDDFMKGIINLRGVGIPIIDLHIKFRLKPFLVTKDSTIIIIEGSQLLGERPIVFGALADSVEDVVEFKNQILEPIPKFANRLPPYLLKGIGKKEHSSTQNLNLFISVLDINRIFTKEEAKILEDIIIPPEII